MKGINGHISVILKDKNEAVKTLGRLITPLFYETRRNHIPAHDEFSFALAQTIPKKLADELSNWSEETTYELDFDELNIVVQSANNPNRAARLPLWDVVSLMRRSGQILTIKITKLRPDRRPRGLAQFGTVETPSSHQGAAGPVKR